MINRGKKSECLSGEILACGEKEEIQEISTVRFPVFAEQFFIQSFFSLLHDNMVVPDKKRFAYRSQ